MSKGYPVSATELFTSMRDKGDTNLYIAAAGAASQLQSYAFSVPGASAYLVGCTFPYSTHDFDAFVGYSPKSYASAEGARALAIAAYIRAKADCAHDLTKKPKKAIGLGLSCAVTAFRPRKGKNKVYGCVISDDGCYEVYKELKKTEDPDLAMEARIYDDLAADKVGLNLLCKVWGLEVNDDTITTLDDLTLMSDLLTRPLFLPNGQRRHAPEIKEAQGKIILYPGSFNPAHEGHRRTAELAVSDTYFGMHSEVVPYITIDPPHKDTITPVDLLTRIAYLQIQMPEHKVLVSRGDPMYVDKAARWPGVTMLLGSDSLDRMLDPKYGFTMESLSKHFAASKTFMIIVSRNGGVFNPAHRMVCPMEWIGSPENKNISSTQIRKSWGL